ncbi:MAG: SagB/ThcOx family dehydrogenase [Acidimicrobiales bacterium]
MATRAFRDADPIAWAFHHNTGVGPYTSAPEPVSEAARPPKEYLHAPLLPLPAAALPDVALADALAARLSCRRFTADGLAPEQLAAVLGAGYGVAGRVLLGRAELLERPVPSGGGLYPLELYVLVRAVPGLSPGAYHYAPQHHGLEDLGTGPIPPAVLSRLFLGQPYLAAAAAMVVITAVLSRSLDKYGDRGYRYVLFEAGHVAQNLNLAAAACGLGACNAGGFFDAHLGDLLGLDPDQEVPLYGVAVGRPASADRTDVRSPPQ